VVFEILSGDRKRGKERTHMSEGLVSVEENNLVFKKILKYLNSFYRFLRKI